MGAPSFEVTAVVPTKDRWSLTARTALAAARLQEDVELEVIVVDDGSQEPPPEDVVTGVLADPRVRVVRHDECRGVAVARNTGVREARGAWVAFLDDDDLWSPRKLRTQIDAARAAGAGFAYSGAVWVDGKLHLDHGHAPPPPEGLASALLRWNVLWGGGSNVVARTDLVRSLGGLDEDLFQLADWDLWIRLALAAPAALVEDVQVALVRHQGSMLLVDRRDVFLELDALAAKHRDAAARAGVQVDRARFARWVANGHLRAGRRREAARTFVRGTREPRNVLRAAGALLGPRAIAMASRIRGRTRHGLADDERVAVERPAWLDLYE
jgi:glycosyltransferase involved in cell wall biosynthesis